MFYCNKCAAKHGYPKTFFKSIGKCECCGKGAVCNEMRSSLLSELKEEKLKKKK